MVLYHASKERRSGNQARYQHQETQPHTNAGAVAGRRITKGDDEAMRAKEFALYKGEELLAMGTKREIAEQLGVSPSTVGYYGTPVYARRTSENGRRLVEL